jgi:hypothetical protein
MILHSFVYHMCEFMILAHMRCIQFLFRKMSATDMVTIAFMNALTFLNSLLSYIAFVLHAKSE